MSGIPPNDLLLMLGDLNAHVGVRDISSELWSDVLDCFGIDDHNQAGKDLCVCLCVRARLSVCVLVCAHTYVCMRVSVHITHVHAQACPH